MPGEMSAQAKNRIRGALIKIWGPEASAGGKGWDRARGPGHCTPTVTSHHPPWEGTRCEPTFLEAGNEGPHSPWRRGWAPGAGAVPPSGNTSSVCAGHLQADLTPAPARSAWLCRPPSCPPSPRPCAQGQRPPV